MDGGQALHALRKALKARRGRVWDLPGGATVKLNLDYDRHRKSTVYWLEAALVAGQMRK